MRSRGDGERLREQSRYVLAYHEWAGSFLSRLGGTAGVFYPLLSQFTQCVLGQERFLFSLLSRKQGPACASGPERTSLMKTEANIPYKFYLEESELPTAWYNVRADMKNKPAPC